MPDPEFKNLKGLRVLLVEDNHLLQRIACFILIKWQVTADTAPDGKAALELLSKNVYDVVLMDIMMPELDGYETTRIFRSQEGPYPASLPIFAFSTNPDPEMVAACNMTGIISKSPIDKEELYLKMSPYLKEH
jgi:CheY-like chemotaxis protein